MIDGLRVTWHGLQNFYHRGYSYIWTNLAFVALSLPVITLPAAFSALMYVGYLAHTDPGEADLAAFWAAFKANFLRATGWGAGNILFALVNFNNVIAYAGIDSPVVAVLEAFWLIAAAIWLGMLFFTWPIYYEMAEPTITGATRNALVMVLQNPLFTFVIVLGLTLIGIVSVILVASWLLLTCGVFAAIANAAVLDRLSVYRKTSR